MRDYSVYIDTNCINAKGKIEAMNELERLNSEEKILLEKTDVMDTELAGKYEPGHKKSQDYIESHGVGVWGHSRWDHCVWGDASDGELLTQALTLLWGEKPREQYSKQEIRDAMNILTAARYGGDFFVTYEKNLMGKDKEFGICVCTPEDCIQYLKEKGVE